MDRRVSGTGGFKQGSCKEIEKSGVLERVMCEFINAKTKFHLSLLGDYQNHFIFKCMIK